ncbi:hypothetical protein TNCV_4112541 [Trichonephila clavipes]|nr:hypothetical protein TNCV_4112541 [Trichonephila clavipes]
MGIWMSSLSLDCATKLSGPPLTSSRVASKGDVNQQNPSKIRESPLGTGDPAPSQIPGYSLEEHILKLKVPPYIMKQREISMKI